MKWLEVVCKTETFSCFSEVSEEDLGILLENEIPGRLLRDFNLMLDEQACTMMVFHGQTLSRHVINLNQSDSEKFNSEL